MQWNMELLKLLKVPQFPNDLKQIIEDAMKAAGSDIGELRIKRATVTLAEADTETKGRVSAGDFKINDGERAIVQVVSTYHLDRDNEVVIPDGIQLNQFNKSGRAFAWNHNYSLGALGVDEKIGSDGGRLIAKSLYSDTGQGTLPDLAFNLRQMGTTQSSIGFIPTDSIEAGDNNWTRSLDKFRATWKDFEQDDEKIKRVITKSILLEHSDVFLASNFNTTVLAKAQELGADDEMVKKMFGVEVSGMPMGDPSILAKAEPKDDSSKADDPDPEPIPLDSATKTSSTPKVIKQHVELVRPGKTEPKVELVMAGPRKASEIISEKVQFEVDMATGKV